jgi:hypothetical protein
MNDIVSQMGENPRSVWSYKATNQMGGPIPPGTLSKNPLPGRPNIQRTFLTYCPTEMRKEVRFRG